MTTSLSEEQRQDFGKNGFVILRGVLAQSALLAALRGEIEALGRTFNPEFTADRADSVTAMGDGQRRLFYKALRYLPALAALAAADFFAGICRSLGIRIPALMRSYNVRMDMPHEDQYLFRWHQDITYLLGSRNSITFWLPMGRADAAHGTIELVPDTHHEIAPFIISSPGVRDKTAQLSPSDIKLVSDPCGPGLVVEADVGDVVVFSQLLLHRSLPNRSSRPRWSVQIRYSDLADGHFRDAGYPFGDMTTILWTDYLR